MFGGYEEIGFDRRVTMSAKEVEELREVHGKGRWLAIACEIAWRKALPEAEDRAGYNWLPEVREGSGSDSGGYCFTFRPKTYAHSAGII